MIPFVLEPADNIDLSNEPIEGIHALFKSKYFTVQFLCQYSYILLDIINKFV